MTTRNALAFAVLSTVMFAALAACGREDAPAGAPAASAPASDALDTPPPLSDAASMPEAAPGPGSPSPANDAPPVVGTWRVVESDGVAPGTTYAFRSDGTLVIQDPAGNPPGAGKWRYQDGKLTIEEDGIAYPTDIVRSGADHLVLRSHNPGGTLDMALERSADATVPEAP